MPNPFLTALSYASGPSLPPRPTALIFILMIGLLSACSNPEERDSTSQDTADAYDSPDTDNSHISDRPTGCESIDNPPGPIVEIQWPNPSNIHHIRQGDTLRFIWNDDTPRNVLQVAAFEGQDAPLGTYSDAGWPQQLRSGDKTTSGQFDWNTGTPPCGYRPGIYFFVDEDNPDAGIVSVALTTQQDPSPHFAPRPCSELDDHLLYNGRYADFAAREPCTQFEVNNFTTPAHFDWVLPTFGARQGDLVIFRWTNLHNVVQVHNVDEDRLVEGGLYSGPRTNCVGGPNESCVNGPYHLGEYFIDTTDHRPGMIHLSDGCAYGCADCPWECRGPDQVPTGTNMQFLLSRADRSHSTEAGACCALDPSKGQDCRVIELFNDFEGMQFDYNVPVNRGDLVRFRWSGELQIVQTEPLEDGSPGHNPRQNGLSMDEPVDCTPGPDWSCLDIDDEDAQLILDVDRAIAEGRAEQSDFGQYFFTFQAYGDNRPGYSSADSGILLYVADDQPYSDNPPCP